MTRPFHIVNGVEVPFTDEEYAAWQTSARRANMEAELSELSSNYEKDTTNFQRMLGTILLADGPTEAAKVAAIRTQWTTRKTQYVTEVAAVRNKYL